MRAAGLLAVTPIRPAREVPRPGVRLRRRLAVRKDRRAMRPPNWPVKHQYRRGTCTAFALVACRELLAWHSGQRDGAGPIDLSEQYSFWGAKDIGGEPAVDWADLESGAISMQRRGVCLQPYWQYQAAPYNDLQDPVTHAEPGTPSDDAHRDALSYRCSYTFADRPSARAVCEAIDKHQAVALSLRVLALHSLAPPHNPILRPRPGSTTPEPANNWMNLTTIRNGVVLDDRTSPHYQYRTIITPEGYTSAHTICVGGYLTGLAGQLWFVLRNSYGRSWGLWPQVGSHRMPRGFGFISGQYVDDHALEMVILSPRNRRRSRRS